MNIWQQFKNLMPSEVTLAGVVSGKSGDVYTVQLASGAEIPARSVGGHGVGSNVFVRNGQVIGAAPDLGTISTIEI